jgi:hypothetical protein
MNVVIEAWMRCFFTLPWRGRVGEHRQMLDGVG